MRIQNFCKKKNTDKILNKLKKKMNSIVLNNQYRKFTDLPTQFSDSASKNSQENGENGIFELIAKAEIGSTQRFIGPFGSRQS